MIEIKVTCDGCGQPMEYSERMMMLVLGQETGHCHSIVVKGITGATEGRNIYHACSEPCIQIIATQRQARVTLLDNDGVIEVKPEDPKGFN